MVEETPVESDPLDKANERIREAAKWLVASAAAVGAALIAGSQLSSIGRLPVGLPTSMETARLWVAGVGVIVGLVTVVYIIWAAVELLIPVTITIGTLADSWTSPTGAMRAPVQFLRESHNKKYLQGFDSPAQLQEHRETVVAELAKTAARPDVDVGMTKDPGARQSRIDELQAYISALDERAAAIEAMAQHKFIVGRFRETLRKLLWATSLAAAGIFAFAWGANPPTAKEPTVKLENSGLQGSSLRDADLRNVDLDKADLTNADLLGADLSGSSLSGTIWSNTICPDGENSDKVGKTCRGHLKPK